MALLGTVISSNIASPTITGSANISSSLANAHTAYASGGYTAGTWYDIFTGETGLNNGMYIMVCYASPTLMLEAVIISGICVVFHFIGHQQAQIVVVILPFRTCWEQVLPIMVIK
jgi:hypothetical protein